MSHDVGAFDGNLPVTKKPEVIPRTKVVIFSNKHW